LISSAKIQTYNTKTL